MLLASNMRGYLNTEGCLTLCGRVTGIEDMAFTLRYYVATNANLDVTSCY